MRKLMVSIIAFLALSAVVGFLATNGLPGGASSTSGGGGTARGTMSPAGPVAGAGEGAVGAPPAGALDQAAGGAPAAGEPSGGGDLNAIGGALPPIGVAVVKTASLEVQVPKGDFDQAFRTAMLVAGRYGGYVQSSSTSGTRVHSGSLTIRVPSASFNQAMDDLSGIGTIQARSISGQDVTNEYVDLNARLRTWEAQEAVLLRLMRDATTVEATLRVQSNLQDVQFRIEQIKGQLRVLENQTQLATIDVSLHEPGAPIHIQRKPQPDERPSLSEAWTKALNGFLGVIYATVVGLGYLVPIAMIGLAVWFGLRRLRPAPSS